MTIEANVELRLLAVVNIVTKSPIIRASVNAKGMNNIDSDFVIAVPINTATPVPKAAIPNIIPLLNPKLIQN